ncbi:MFS transporter [Actinocorallia sp. B10E7]|uniref:MFS transporter n=1 Tax=Actinocorallia sp. B10E7 TaxID=3153558 RepID=UPI00325DE682
MLLYPVYSLLFAETGLSTAQISTLLILWSSVSFLLEIPSGVLADAFSRRRLLVLAPLITGLGYGLWTFLPSYPAFAAGFVLWGAGGALASGALEALVYEELARLGAGDSYPRVFGRARALGTTAAMASSVVAAPVMAAGGFLALGIASVIVPLFTAAVAWSLPEHRGGGEDPEEDEEPGLRVVLRDGLALVRTAPVVRRLLLAVVLVSGFSAMDEYLPLLAAEASGAALALVPLLVLLPAAGDAVGGWFAGRGGSRLPVMLALAALCLAAGALARHPLGFVPIGVAFGFAQWAMVVTEARLQDRLSDRSRATVTSLAGLGMEVIAVLVFAAYGLGSLWSPSWLLFALAALPQLLLALVLRGRRG